MSETEKKLSVWSLPDPESIELPKDVLELIERTAISKVQLDNVSDIGAPGEEWVYENREVDLAEYRKSEELSWRKILRWKSPNNKPAHYLPPKDLEELKERVRTGETYLRNSTIDKGDLTEFPGSEARFDLTGSTFINCTFSRGVFDGVDFSESVFEQCDFSESTFNRTRFVRAVLDNCRGFESFSCIAADFTEASFKGNARFSSSTKLQRANFRSCELSHVTGLVPDGNNFLFANLPDELRNDDWSILRRRYTGFYLFINGLMLLLFLAPFITKLVSLVAYGQLMSEWEDARVVIEGKLPAAAMAKIIKILSDNGGYWSECGAETCEYQWAIWVALTSPGASLPFRIAGVLAATHFVVRFWMTKNVASLREHESRTYYMPLISEYAGIRKMDRFVNFLKWPLLFFYIYILGDLAFTKVPILR